MSDNYVVPETTDDSHRLDAQHAAFTLTLNGRLHPAPYDEVLSKSPNGKVADLGTGTGTWAVELAQKYPGVEVLGVDTSEVKKSSSIPPNVRFLKHDIRLPFPAADFAPGSFDVIHARFVLIHIPDAASVLRSIRPLLKPDGILLLSEANMSVLAKTDGSNLEPYVRVSEMQGYNPNMGRKLVPLLREVGGWKDMSEWDIEAPVGSWPEDEHEKRIGALLEENLRGSLIIADDVVQQRGKKEEIVMWGHVKGMVINELEEGAEKPKWCLTYAAARRMP